MCVTVLSIDKYVNFLNMYLHHCDLCTSSALLCKSLFMVCRTIMITVNTRGEYKQWHETELMTGEQALYL